jgi:2-amino-4-hydroxy-6-hydroxymethyldihydropteridine diphosphokinase
VTAYVALGSNLGDRRGTIERALGLLGDESEVRVDAVSRIAETDPVDYLDQPRFLNAVARVETTLDPRELLERLLDVERCLGRTREGPRFGPRTIDLDLLLYDDDVVEQPRLEVPHPRLHERRFLLELLADVAGEELVIPGRGRLKDLLARLD